MAQQSYNSILPGCPGRDNLVFPYPSGEVAGAACSKWDHHLARLKHYRAVVAAAEADLMANGVKITDSRTNGIYSTDVGGVDINVDYERRNAVEEARRKVEEHKHLCDRFRAFTRGLQQNDPDKDLVYLTADDIAFFGLDGSEE